MGNGPGHPAFLHRPLVGLFLVPTGKGPKGTGLERPGNGKGIETALARILKQGWFDIKTTEAHHFRRVILQGYGISPESLPERLKLQPDPVLLRTSRGVGDGRGFVFISHWGVVCPSGFLPLSAGYVKDQPLNGIYRESPLFKKLRDPDSLKEENAEKCEYRRLCGGSRARAYALTGDVMGADPFCAYIPAELSATG